VKKDALSVWAYLAATHNRSRHNFNGRSTAFASRAGSFVRDIPAEMMARLGIKVRQQICAEK
jgi:hypothetical protein